MPAGPVVVEDPMPHVARGVTLLRGLGLGAGDRVVVMLGNDLPTFGVLAAACLEGVVAVPLPTDAGSGELAEIVTDARPRAVVHDPTLTRAAATLPDLPAGVVATVAAWRPSDLLGLAATEPANDRPLTRPMTYTSGTTGRRKGVHVGVRDAGWGSAWIDDELRAFDRRHGDRHLVVAPLHHAAPFRFALVTALTGGHLGVLPRFSTDHVREALRTMRPTSTFCVPTHLSRLLAARDLSADDLASLSLLAHAGAPCPEAVKRAILEPAPDGAVWEFYGATEGQFTVCPPDVWRAAPGSVGRARPGVRLSIRDDRGGPQPSGTIGTIWAEVPDHARFRYWDDDARTAAAWDGDAFTVGDLGWLDDAGRLTLAGRDGDLILTGGVNVYPAEVERVLLGVEGVAEAAVFGVPDDDRGEIVVAAVVPSPGHRLAAEPLRSLLAAALTRSKVPARVMVVDDLPRTAMGKVRRVDLAAELGGGA